MERKKREIISCIENHLYIKNIRDNHIRFIMRLNETEVFPNFELRNVLHWP